MRAQPPPASVFCDATLSSPTLTARLPLSLFYLPWLNAQNATFRYAGVHGAGLDFGLRENATWSWGEQIMLNNIAYALTVEKTIYWSKPKFPKKFATCKALD